MYEPDPDLAQVPEGLSQRRRFSEFAPHRVRLRTRNVSFSTKNMLVAYLVGGNIVELQRFSDF